MKKYITFFFMFITGFLQAKEPIVTAEKLIEHKKAVDHIDNFQVPETVLICYQQSTLDYLLKKHPEFHRSKVNSHFYTNTQVGILGGWGVGAPGLAIRMEELIVLGTKRFIAVGTAGGLMNQHQITDFVICPKALAEDGVAHLYLPENQTTIAADGQMISECKDFAKERTLPSFQPAMAWSFSAIFRETVEDVLRVKKLGCSVVEMEAATLFAIGQDKNVATLSLFVISDSITDKAWTPQLKDPTVRKNLHQLADWALEFCMADVPSKTECH
jgi:uridine phosphorylase